MMSMTNDDEENDDDEDDISVQYVLPIITGFKLSYDDIDNAIICDMEIYE